MSNLIIRPSSNHLPPFPPRLASLRAPTTHLTHVRSVSSPSPPPPLRPCSVKLQRKLQEEQARQRRRRRRRRKRSEVRLQNKQRWGCIIWRPERQRQQHYCSCITPPLLASPDMGFLIMTASHPTHITKIIHTNDAGLLLIHGYHNQPSESFLPAVHLKKANLSASIFVSKLYEKQGTEISFQPVLGLYTPQSGPKPAPGAFLLREVGKRNKYCGEVSGFSFFALACAGGGASGVTAVKRRREEEDDGGN
ncbi:hypothetical protein MUK42_14294 [Musa troglodytarum]|uniref:Uncharacterized protein n=1 Tax=Musa troglodytarum TaxID=320322 RepID=A0A9E7IGA0_9LILI|nr:hypothetical protein MUK42_14294 [Musa troglodytarum]